MKKIILIDFEGIQSYGLYIPYMFSMAIKKDEKTYKTFTKSIDFKKLNYKNWSKLMLEKIENVVFNELSINSWNEFNDKAEFYGWAPAYENKIFRNLKISKNIVVKDIKDNNLFKAPLALNILKNKKDKNQFPKFYSIISNKKILELFPGLAKSEINKKIIGNNGHTASVCGYIYWRLVNNEPTWNFLKKYISKEEIFNEMRNYSYSDIQTMIYAFQIKDQLNANIKQICNLISTNAKLEETLNNDNSLYKILDALKNTKHTNLTNDYIKIINNSSMNENEKTLLITFFTTIFSIKKFEDLKPWLSLNNQKILEEKIKDNSNTLIKNKQEFNSLLSNLYNNFKKQNIKIIMS
ncbi:hypothetical protein [Mycoplasma elephantis]|uniref:hypothetical protein n=1 Tax=Mycoplasma elephantis TaxID=114882 RepID=UPI0004872244|nr:hypothetical protein [Mycoplasma elephantis]